MDIRERFRRWFRLRFAIIYPLGVYVIFFANSNDDSIIRGIWFIVIGLLLRLCANGYAVKLEKLTTCGPYAFMRHPLYLGTLLLTVGFIIMLKIYYIGGLFLGLMAVVYYRTIKKEEAMLEEKFKDRYLNYKKRTPALLPTIFPYREAGKWPFSFKRLIKSQEYKLFLWTIILVIAFHLKDEFLVERETMDMKIWALIIAAFILGISDLVIEFIKRRNRVKVA